MTQNPETNLQPVHKDSNFLQQRVDAYYTNRVEKTWHGKHILKGLAPDKNSILINNNDYLSLGGNPAIAQAQIKTILKEGSGLMMSSVFYRGETLERRFETTLADFIHSEDVVLSQSGWCANVGLIQSIARENIPVYIDMFAHTSLWEGIQSASATPRPFRHNDCDHLEKLIKRYGEGVIIVDSVYSTDGDVAPLKEIIDIAHRYGCISVVDESHSLGTYGEHGEGLVVSLGLTDKVDFRTASLAKAFCGRGGIIAGSAKVLEYIRYEARPAIFSSAVLNYDIAGFLAALELIKKDNWRRIKLHANADFLRNALTDLGYNITASKSQIIGLEAGLEQKTMILRDALEARGIFGAVFCWPATPKCRSLVRLSVNAGLQQESLDRIIKICSEIREEVEMSQWPSTLRLKRKNSPKMNIVSMEIKRKK